MSSDISADSTISEAGGWETAKEPQRTVASLFGCRNGKTEEDLLCNKLCLMLLPETKSVVPQEFASIVVQPLSRVRLCNPVDWNTPGFPVLHCFNFMITDRMLPRTKHTGETGVQWSRSRISQSWEEFRSSLTPYPMAESFHNTKKGSPTQLVSESLQYWDNPSVSKEDQLLLFNGKCLLFSFLAAPRGMWGFSSPTKDQTHTPCTGSAES